MSGGVVEWMAPVPPCQVHVKSSLSQRPWRRERAAPGSKYRTGLERGGTVGMGLARYLEDWEDWKEGCKGGGALDDKIEPMRLEPDWTRLG